MHSIQPPRHHPPTLQATYAALLELACSPGPIDADVAGFVETVRQVVPPLNAFPAVLLGAAQHLQLALESAVLALLKEVRHEGGGGGGGAAPPACLPAGRHAFGLRCVQSMCCPPPGWHTSWAPATPTTCTCRQVRPPAFQRAWSATTQRCNWPSANLRRWPT